MAPNRSAVVIQAAVDGNLRLLKKMARNMDLQQVRGTKGRNVLHIAAAAGNLELCRFLVEELGFDANSTSAEGETPVVVANEAVRGVVPVLTYLLVRGGDPTVPDAKGRTPLHRAAEYGHHEAVRLLLSKGVAVDPINGFGTPLHVAAAKGHDIALKVLLEHGADPNRFVNLFTPLAMAFYGCSLKCMKLLVEAGADVNFRGPSSPHLLFNAVDFGLTDIVKFLLEAGPDPNNHDGYGKFPIMIAAAHGHRELVEILFHRTKPIPSIHDWTIDRIIRTMKNQQYFEPGELEKRAADAKLQGKEAFAKGDYHAAIHNFSVAMITGQSNVDATLFSNRSLCWLRLGEGEKALSDARQCKMLCPRWVKAWYREGVALSLLKNYKGAVDVFEEALKLDPANDEIKKAISEAMEAMGSSARSEEQNP
ncbi:unnamed protein product [Urochloa humidicola]